MATDADRLDAYRALYDGLSNMVEGGRLTEADVPDDWQWLMLQMAAIEDLDPAPGTVVKVHAERD